MDMAFVMNRLKVRETLMMDVGSFLSFRSRFVSRPIFCDDGSFARFAYSGVEGQTD
jgi:hypothetical protein